MDKSSFSWPAEFVSNSDFAVFEQVAYGEQPVSEQAADQQAGSEGSVSRDVASEIDTLSETISKQPTLSFVLNKLYEQTFGYDEYEDNRQEKSANDSLLLLSANFRCTNNPYFLAKIVEIYESIVSGEGKWTCDLWHMSLVKFAYSSSKCMSTDDARKVLKSVTKLYRKTNPGGIAKNVTITAIITLKRGLVVSGAHINHQSAYQLIVKGCPEVCNLPDHTSDMEIAQIVGKLVSNLPHHLPPSPPHDELFEANNYFILRDLKSCLVETNNQLRTLEVKLDRIEEDKDMQDYIIRQVTSHHEYDGILKELDADESDWEKIRYVQMRIVQTFAKISRSRFLARYPTAFLFNDIDEQLLVHDIDVSDLISSDNLSDSAEWDVAVDSNNWDYDAVSNVWYDTPDRAWERVTGGDEGSRSGEGHTAWTSDDWASGAW